jgi:hypothetical protein
MMGFPDQSIDGSGLSTSGYRVTSNMPIVAYQFNPLDNADVFSNDGSLLIPRHAFDIRYIALTWPTLARRPETNDYNSYTTVVAWEDGTEIRVIPSTNVRPGAGFAAIAAGTPTTFTLDAYQVLNLEAGADGDMTGTIIEAVDGTSTFGVFAGHEAMIIQNTSSSCCADHVEEMMFPTSTWGQEYVVARSKSRGMNEADVIRVLAQADGTTVSVNPPISPACPTLGVGQYCEFDIMGDVEISASQPILVGHYLKSVIVSGFGGSMGTGDPALSLAVPTEQFRTTHTFLVPSQYKEQFISVVTPAGSTVLLDGTDVTAQFSTFGSGDWTAARIPVSPGQRKIDCPGGCGVEVYGYDNAVSYLFAAGLDLTQIVID